MPKLALVVPSLHQGGGVRTVARFVRDVALRDGSWEVKPVSLCMASGDVESTSLRAPSSWFRGVRVGRRDWLGAAVPHVGASLGELEFQRYRPRRALTRLLSDCDVVQVVGGSPAWANAVLDLGRPVALQVATLARVERRQRDAMPRNVTDWWRKGMTRITSRLDDRALRRVDAIQVENPWMLDYARTVNGNRAVDIRYAPPGVDTERYRPLATDDRLADPYVLCVGRLGDPRKNIGMLVEAYARLPVSLQLQARLVLAGSSGPPEAFWRRADELHVRDRVSYVANPDTDALLGLYQHASAFALPSDEEGFGMVLIEAMACGVPVVATRCGGPEGIVTDGEDGYLVPRDDGDAMSARIAGLLQDRVQSEALGAAARRTVERRYDERVAGEVFTHMWDRLLHTESCVTHAG